MAFFNRTEIGLKDTSQTATVPDDPRAKLMYYLHCMCSVLKLDDDADINRLRRYQNYFLSHADTSILLHLCILLKPDVLLNKCIFQNDSLCGNSGNKFFDLQRVQHNMLVAGSVLIGGQSRQVTKIMTFKMPWLTENWTTPMQILMARQKQEREEAQRRQQILIARQAREREEAQRRQRQLIARQRREREEAQRRQQESKTCTIL